MTRTLIAMMQTAWDCRWSLPRFPPARLDGGGPGAIWMCTRTGRCRNVDENTCERCPHWEADIDRVN